MWCCRYVDRRPSFFFFFFLFVAACSSANSHNYALCTVVPWTIFTGGSGWTTLVRNMPKSLAIIATSWSGDDRIQLALKALHENKTGYLLSSQGELNRIRKGTVFVGPTPCRSDDVLRSPIQSVHDLFQRVSRLFIPGEDFFLRREDGINNLYPANLRSTERISGFASSLASQIILHWFWPFRRITHSPAITSSIRSASAMKLYLPKFLPGMVLSINTIEGATTESWNNWSERSTSLDQKSWIWKTWAASRTPRYWLPTLSTASPGHPASLCGR